MDSYDPDGNKGNKPMTYKWTIRNMDDSAVVSPTTREAVTLEDKAQISLNATGNLAIGKSYKFKVGFLI